MNIELALSIENIKGTQGLSECFPIEEIKWRPAVFRGRSLIFVKLKFEYDYKFEVFMNYLHIGSRKNYKMQFTRREDGEPTDAFYEVKGIEEMMKTKDEDGNIIFTLCIGYEKHEKIVPEEEIEIIADEDCEECQTEEQGGTWPNEEKYTDNIEEDFETLKRNDSFNYKFGLRLINRLSLWKQDRNRKDEELTYHITNLTRYLEALFKEDRTYGSTTEKK